MSKKTGLSMEEKCRRALDYFFATKGVFQLKELEKQLPKEKGITMQSVKDVIKALQDDDLIDTDKIGTSTYYWGFPSKRYQSRKRELESLEKNIAKYKAGIEELDAELEKSGSDDIEERMTKMAELKRLTSERDQLKSKVDAMKYNNPAFMEEMVKEIKLLKRQVNNSTDHIMNIRAYCRDKFGLEESAFNRQFELDDDFDYLE